MSKNKNTYHAFVTNDEGCGESAGSDNNLALLKKSVRERYGKGWTVTIDKVEHDGEGGWFEPEEVARFRLRK